jgi:hypothetical protein
VTRTPAPRHGAAAWVEGSTAHVLGGQTVLHLGDDGRLTSFMGSEISLSYCLSLSLTLSYSLILSLSH